MNILMTFGRKTANYNPQNKSKFWKLINKVKRLQIVGSARGITLPKRWLQEMDWRHGDFLVLTYDILKEQVVIRKVVPGELEFEKINQLKSG